MDNKITQKTHISTQSVDKQKDKTLPPLNLAMIAKVAFVAFIAFLSQKISLQMPFNQPVNKATSNGSLSDLCQISYYLSICAGNLGIPRKDMPQLSQEKHAGFFSHLLDNHNISTVIMRISPTKLVPAQSEMHYEKVLKYIPKEGDNATSPCNTPIIVSSGDTDPEGKKILRVIDGHHRYAACRIMGANMTVSAIAARADEVFHHLFNYPGVEKEGFNAPAKPAPT